jgi:hypothetical protein
MHEARSAAARPRPAAANSAIVSGMLGCFVSSQRRNVPPVTYSMTK